MKTIKRLSHTAIHEAGHAVLNILLDAPPFLFVEIASAPVTAYSIWHEEVREGERLGRVAYAEGTTVTYSSRFGAWDYAMTLWGGIEAESIRSRQSALLGILGGGSNDFAQIRAEAEARTQDPVWRDRFIEGTEKDARQLLKENWDYVLRVATALDAAKHLTFEEVAALATHNEIRRHDHETL